MILLAPVNASTFAYLLGHRIIDLGERGRARFAVLMGNKLARPRSPATGCRSTIRVRIWRVPGRGPVAYLSAG